MQGCKDDRRRGGGRCVTEQRSQEEERRLVRAASVQRVRDEFSSLLYFEHQRGELSDRSEWSGLGAH